MVEVKQDEETKKLDNLDLKDISADGYEFPEEHKDGLSGLAYLGYLEDTFQYKGHEFAIQTYPMKTLLHVFAVAEKYEGDLGKAKALMVAQVAACIDTVDGEIIAEKIGDGESDRSILDKKVKVVSEWYPHVIEYTYKQLAILWIKMNKLLDALD